MARQRLSTKKNLTPAQKYERLDRQYSDFTGGAISIDWDEKGKVSPQAGDIHRTKQANELRTFWEEKVGDSLLFATGDYNCQQNSQWLRLAAKEAYFSYLDNHPRRSKGEYYEY